MGPNSASHSPSTAVTHCMYSCRVKAEVREPVMEKNGSAHSCQHRQRQAPFSNASPHLGGHHQFMVDNIVGSVAHPKKRAGRVQVATHPCADVDVFPDALQQSRKVSLARPQFLHRPLTALGNQPEQQPEDTRAKGALGGSHGGNL